MQRQTCAIRGVDVDVEARPMTHIPIHKYNPQRLHLLCCRNNTKYLLTQSIHGTNGHPLRAL